MPSGVRVLSQRATPASVTGWCVVISTASCCPTTCRAAGSMRAACHPSSTLMRVVEAAVAEEVAAFLRLFGHAPRVVVPTTFVWTRRVEQAWARHGLRFLVTCGKRFVARDAAGKLIDDGARTAQRRNRQRAGLPGAGCLLRAGQGPPRARCGAAAAPIRGLCEAAAVRNPPLQFHVAESRGGAGLRRARCADRRTCVEQHPQLRFLSTEELGDAIASRYDALIDDSCSGAAQGMVAARQQAAGLSPLCPRDRGGPPDIAAIISAPATERLSCPGRTHAQIAKPAQAAGSRDPRQESARGSRARAWRLVGPQRPAHAGAGVPDRLLALRHYRQLRNARCVR